MPPAEGSQARRIHDRPPGDEPRDRTPTDASLYALEKLAQAVDELATGTSNLSDRLYEAAYYILRIQPDDTLEITDSEDAKAVAHRILELYRELWIRLMR